MWFSNFRLCLYNPQLAQFSYGLWVKNWFDPVSSDPHPSICSDSLIGLGTYKYARLEALTLRLSTYAGSTHTEL